MTYFSCQAPTDSQGHHDEQNSQTRALLSDVPSSTSPRVKTGAENLLESSLDLLRDKKVAIVANHTSVVYDSIHLVDTLLAANINVVKVFSPEHGFRGTADAGEKVSSGKDLQTGLPIVSLYGQQRKPDAAQLTDIDIVIFDIQDVGTRFYTYISTMSYVMETCAETQTTFWVLDRPNPNGWYVEGPLMQKAFSSFIGLHEVPVSHGMTVGEYAAMVKGENWIQQANFLEMEIFACQGYTHKMTWEETGLNWIAPSPNLGSAYAAYLYPAICWFEPTTVSVGRGTNEAFTLLGSPWFEASPSLDSTARKSIQLIPYEFTPQSLPGKSKYPKHQGQLCKGFTFEGKTDGASLFMLSMNLMRDFWRQSEALNQEAFFKKGFEKWSGYEAFKDEIISDKPIEEIWKSWQEDVYQFKEIRKEYLMYTDVY